MCSALISRTSRFFPAFKVHFFLETPEQFTLIVHEPKGSGRLGGIPKESWDITWFDHDDV